MNSRSWSTFYNEDLLNEHVDSLLPQICLHQIWAELPDQNIMLAQCWVYIISL